MPIASSTTLRLPARADALVILDTCGCNQLPRWREVPIGSTADKSLPTPRKLTPGTGLNIPRQNPLSDRRSGVIMFLIVIIIIYMCQHIQPMSLHWRDRGKAWDCIWPGRGTAYGPWLISYGMLLSPPHLRQASFLLHACAQPHQQLRLRTPSPRPFLSFSEYGARELVYLHMHHTCTAHDRRGRTRTSNARAELRAHLNWCHRGQ
jgi:hypothetical protein